MTDINMVGQDLLAYACSCGFRNENKKIFNNHLLTAARKDGKGVHKSLGRVNPTTGEVVMPPFNERSKEEKQASTYALKKKGSGEIATTIKQTEIYADATQIKFVPRVLVASFTPIMLAGKRAAEEIWGWRPDMPFENFLDTIIFHFFRDRGIDLAIYRITDPELHAQIKQQNLEQQQEVILNEEEEAQDGN
ncbi:MAG: hypothetical protein PHC43_00140 [Candidatus Marinimicrobia bacterium]|jgi:hypothetical protein|nr:hypothetical protein [Candidatus Neomarinimicrobiota bacterium]